MRTGDSQVFVIGMSLGFIMFVTVLHVVGKVRYNGCCLPAISTHPGRSVSTMSACSQTFPLGACMLVHSLVDSSEPCSRNWTQSTTVPSLDAAARVNARS